MVCINIFISLNICYLATNNFGISDFLSVCTGMYYYLANSALGLIEYQSR